MFRITCMVDDKKLPHAIRALAACGAYDVTPQPVENAKKTRGGVVAVTQTGTAADQFLAYCAKEKTRRFTQAIVREWLRTLGKSDISSYVIGQLKKRKAIVRVGDAGNKAQYEVKK